MIANWDTTRPSSLPGGNRKAEISGQGLTDSSTSIQNLVCVRVKLRASQLGLRGQFWSSAVLTVSVFMITRLCKLYKAWLVQVVYLHGVTVRQCIPSTRTFCRGGCRAAFRTLPLWAELS